LRVLYHFQNEKEQLQTLVNHTVRSNSRTAVSLHSSEASLMLSETKAAISFVEVNYSSTQVWLRRQLGKLTNRSLNCCFRDGSFIKLLLLPWQHQAVAMATPTSANCTLIARFSTACDNHELKELTKTHPVMN
jgi:hypothetical protein